MSDPTSITSLPLCGNNKVDVQIQVVDLRTGPQTSVGVEQTNIYCSPCRTF